MKNSVAPPKSATCAFRAGLVNGVPLSSTNSPINGGTANAAGTKPGTALG
jgi:hypothetical protein